MKRTLVGFAISIIICVAARWATAGDKIDVPKVITKSDAEKILGVPVKDAKGRNQNGTDGYYDSEWSYHAINGEKALMFDVLYAGRKAPPHLTQTMFSVLPADGGKSTPITGLGDKAIFCPNETGMAMLHVVKGDILITIGIHSLPANAALDPEKSLATKILANL
ncbi:MAG TPA: hypothetical protein VH229_12470 [Candidatus Udaeobacter sp.]|jgi:hypothetical protein|nr:hypothetical protein [Candidatus Udaeobacter sp.]